MATPAFYVEVVMGGYVGQSDDWRYPRLTWHCLGGFSTGGMNSTVAQRKAKLGRYECIRVPAIGVAEPLIAAPAPKVELEVGLAARVLAAFETGYVSNEDVAAIRKAINYGARPAR